MTHRIFITGAAGYIGGMLCDLFARRADVECIIALDKEPSEHMPPALRGNPKIKWVEANTADASWRALVAAEAPDVVIHLAWQIRELFGQGELQRRWNLDGADAVFDFCFATPSVKRLIHFSTVSSYGAEPANRTERRFTEKDGLRASSFRYAEEKRIVEKRLEDKFALASQKGAETTVVVLRPATLAGPRGRARGAGLLQSTLSRHAEAGVLRRVLARLTAMVPVTAHWCRQYLHEDDLADCVALLALAAPTATRYEVFNVGPPGEVMRGDDLARAFGKRAVRVHPQLIRFAFFLLWHGTRGRIATPAGAWKSYCFPLVVDSAKLTESYGFAYRMGSKQAFLADVGRYANVKRSEQFVEVEEISRLGTVPAAAAIGGDK
jgi:nucleoside-diphosphate-sugar epimerase